MKYFEKITVLAATAFTICSAIAQPGNSGFEKWEMRDYELLKGQDNYIHNSTEGSKTTDAQKGKFALKVSGQLLDLDDYSGDLGSFDSVVFYAKAFNNGNNLLSIVQISSALFDSTNNYIEGSYAAINIQLLADNTFRRYAVQLRPNFDTSAKISVWHSITIMPALDTNTHKTYRGTGNHITIDNIQYKNTAHTGLPLWGDFEQWYTESVELPEGWHIINIDSLSRFKKVSDSNLGKYALKLTTIVDSLNVIHSPSLESGFIKFSLKPDYVYFTVKREGTISGTMDQCNFEFKMYTDTLTPFTPVASFSTGINSKLPEFYKTYNLNISSFISLSDFYMKISITGGVTNNSLNNFSYLIDEISFDQYSKIIEPKSSVSSSHVFPNPARDVLTITGHDKKPLSYNIYNVKGQSVKDGSFHDIQNAFAINISDLPPGVYQIKIISHDRITRQKFIVDR